MFEWIVLARLATLGCVIVVILGYWSDVRRMRESASLLPEWLLGIGIALFVWLMGWLA